MKLILTYDYVKRMPDNTDCVVLKFQKRSDQMFKRVSEDGERHQKGEFPEF
jgi:hypothetical protein